MSEAFADSSSKGPSVDSPAARSAADDFRAAAEGKAPSREFAPAADEQHPLKRAAKKAGQFRDFAGEKAESLKSAASQKLEAIRDGAEDTVGQFKDVAGDQWHETRAKAQELHATMEDYIRANPTKAVLTAAGIGLFLGLITRR